MVQINKSIFNYKQAKMTSKNHFSKAISTDKFMALKVYEENTAVVEKCLDFGD